MNATIQGMINAELSKKKYSNVRARRLVYNWLAMNCHMTRSEENLKALIDKMQKYFKDGKLFENEYKRMCRNIKIYKRTKKDVKFLERHAYAPEMNKLHTNKGVFSVPQQTTIKDAIKYLIATEIS